MFRTKRTFRICSCFAVRAASLAASSDSRRAKSSRRPDISPPPCGTVNALPLGVSASFPYESVLRNAFDTVGSSKGFYTAESVRAGAPRLCETRNTHRVHLLLRISERVRCASQRVSPASSPRNSSDSPISSTRKRCCVFWETSPPAQQAQSGEQCGSGLQHSSARIAICRIVLFMNYQEVQHHPPSLRWRDVECSSCAER